MARRKMTSPLANYYGNGNVPDLFVPASVPGVLVLPAFQLLKRQSDPPHVSRVIVEKAIPNEHGAQIVYTLRVNRKGTEWWISATLVDRQGERGGLRMSNTLHTTSSKRAFAWMIAIESSTISCASAV